MYLRGAVGRGQDSLLREPFQGHLSNPAHRYIYYVCSSTALSIHLQRTSLATLCIISLQQETTKDSFGTSQHYALRVLRFGGRTMRRNQRGRQQLFRQPQMHQGTMQQAEDEGSLQ